MPVAHFPIHLGSQYTGRKQRYAGEWRHGRELEDHTPRT
jgi:hypothetical protein